jgi:RHS repeat-associated protein
MDSAGGVGGLLWVTLHTTTGPASGTHFTCYDGNGNIVSLVSASSGEVTARYEYGPFGEPIRVSGPAASLNPFRFSTKRTENNTDLVLYEYRAYSQSLGRWLTKDLLGEQGGVNLYVSFNDEPVGYIDRSGLDNWSSLYKWQESLLVIIYPLTPTAELTQTRPDNRDRPQTRPDRRCPLHVLKGDTNCDRCGPDVTVGLEATMNAVRKRFDPLPDDEKSRVCSLEHLYSTWDIVFPSPPAGCGEGACYDTVMVKGTCYDKWKVNYILFGRISKLCDFWRNKMEGLVAIQKLIRKPIIDGDWEYEYTGDVRGFMRIGYDWNGSLPSSLPGPTGGFSGCKPCDRIGSADLKFRTAFMTTWP